MDENVVLLELAAVLPDYDHFPTLQEFSAAGRSGLYCQVEETGGPERWAGEFGLPYLPEERDPEEQRLRRELAEFLSRFDHWPTPAEFRRARQWPLYDLVLAHGGVERWRQAFGLPTSEEFAQAESTPGRRSAGRSRRRQWTPELVRSALDEFLQDAEHFPSEREFRKAGENGLFKAVLRFGGINYWAAEFGLPTASDLIRERVQQVEAARVAAREDRRGRRDRMARELEEFCAGREFFPAYSDWKAAGRTDLQTFVNATGGVQEWSKRLGLRLRPVQDRSPYGMERALADGRAVIAQFGRIPNQKALQYAGYNKLWKFIRREFDGDRAAFAALCL